MKILANDGIAKNAVEILNENGFEVYLEKVDQENLIEFINTNKITVLLVRSATQVRKNLIDKCKSLKIVGRGGVGMDNIDVDYAKKKDIHVINTPAASSTSVAELVFAHLLGLVRFLYDSNRKMPLEGDQDFKKLKKSYSKGEELYGKTLGIVGFGRIGQEVAKRAIGLGMNILAHDKFIKKQSEKALAKQEEARTTGQAKRIANEKKYVKDIENWVDNWFNYYGANWIIIWSIHWSDFW